MRFWMQSFRSFTCLILFSVISAADVIVDVSSSNLCCGPFVNAEQAIQIYWTQPQAYDNISISVPLLWTDITSFDINAYLTTSTGPGTSPPPLASSSFSATGSSTPIDATLFSGLTLDAGTYYLTLYGADPTGPIWVGVQPTDSTLSITTAPGVTISNAYQTNGSILDAVYAPASSFFLNGDLISTGTSYQDVTITGAVVPEPGPTWPLTAGAGIILLFSKKLRRSSPACGRAG
jgi:hypothetical protein